MMAAGIDPRWRLDTPTDLPDAAVREISAALNAFVADAFALYLKIKNFHWHISGPHFATLHSSMSRPSRSSPPPTCFGGTTLRSVGDVARHQSIKDNDAQFVAPNDMLRELMDDNKAMAAPMRRGHAVAEKHADAATAGLLETFIDEAEKRTWFLFEASRTHR